MKFVDKKTLRSLALVLGISICSTSAFAAISKKPYLIYEGNNSTMTVLWQDNAVEATNTISWGTDTSYGLGSVTVPEYEATHLHKYQIGGLQSSTKYYYQVADSASGQVYGTGSFVTAPDASASAVKFLAFGDTRSGPLAMEGVIQEMRKVYAADPAYQSLNLQAGDWVSSDAESSWTAQWFNTNPQTQLLLSEQPINGVKGNHEDSSGYSTFFPKYYPFPYPYLANKAGSTTAFNNLYWSFDYGPVHFTVVDQYSGYAVGSPQYTWLENDLKTTSKPWKILVYHEPAWTAGTHTNNTTTQAVIDPLVKKYKVDLVYSGHNHNYARCQVDNYAQAGTDTIVPQVPYITNGGGGAGLYAVDTTNTGLYKHVVKALAQYEYSTFDVNDKTLTMKAYAVTKADGTNLSASVINPNTMSTPIETVVLKHYSDVSSQVAVASTGFLYSRLTGKYSGTLTVTNNGPSDLTGNVDVVLNDLTAGVTLANAAGLYQARPYLSVSTSGLAAGASVTVPVQFTNPANAKITFTTATFQE
jgi:predicted phosphodiesterase